MTDTLTHETLTHEITFEAPASGVTFDQLLKSQPDGEYEVRGGLVFSAPQHSGRVNPTLAQDLAYAAYPPAAVIEPVAEFQVRQEGPYRFEAGQFRPGGEFDFSTDLFAAGRDGTADREAGQRALAFVQQQFAVAQTNVQSTLPPGTDRVGYVDQRQYAYPLLTALHKGKLDNIAPFSFPKFNSASGMVAPHTEGVEPGLGSMTTTSQTVQPRALSGKVEITREVFDQGGSPQVSNMIFERMRRSYLEAAEGSIVALLEANAAQVTDIPLTAGGTNKALVAELTRALADLSYVRGGFLFDVMPTQVDLYRALATAADDQGRPLLPATGVANANGSAGKYWQSLNVNGVEATPAWALASTGNVAANSWLIDSSSVYEWHSEPLRLDFNFGASVQVDGAVGNLRQVAMVTIGLFGYAATAISDTAGVRQITYKPTV